MMRQWERELLEIWLTHVHGSLLPKLESFAHGVVWEKVAVHAECTLPIYNGRVEGEVTRMKRIKRMIYGKAGFVLLRQHVL